MATDFYLTLPSKVSIKVPSQQYIGSLYHGLNSTCLAVGRVGVRNGRDPGPAHLVQSTRGGHLVLLQRGRPCVLTQSTKIDAVYHHSAIILLTRMWTDKVWAKLSYSPITQEIMFHMSTSTEFTNALSDGNHFRIPFFGCHKSSER